MKTRVLVVEQSDAMRQLFVRELSRDPELDIIGSASDPYIARDMIVHHHPDMITLDLEMTSIDGLVFLKKLMRYYPLPIVAVTSSTNRGGELSLAAMEAGAVDVMFKPESALCVEGLFVELTDKIKAAARAHVSRRSGNTGPLRVIPSRLPALKPCSTVIAIGTSTGGPQALQQVLMAMPANAPGIVIVQHMPEYFTHAFANRLNQLCAIEVKEAADGDTVAEGRALIAPGNFHMLLRRTGTRYHVQVKSGPLVCRHRPSVDVLFRSVARAAGGNAIGVIMTGMGTDGAESMLELKQSGATTIAQDEASSVVFGMPREAIRLNAVDHIVSLDRIAGKILDLVASKNAATTH